MTRHRAARCPHCRGSPAAVRVVFGLPSPDLVAAAERGQVVLGGCLVLDGEPLPRKACPQCAQHLG